MATTTKTTRSGLDEFRAIITDYKTIGPWVMGGTVFVPLVDYFLKLGPPWPDGLAILTSIAEFLVLIGVFHFGLGKVYKRVSRRMIVALVLLILCFGTYLYLSSLFIFSVGSERFVKGFIVRPDVAPLIRSDYTADDALADSEYRSEAVWTTGSITAMRLILLSLWLMSFISLTITIALFVIYQRRKPGPA